MSGDSPNTHQTDIFDFKDQGRQSPAPTTSKDAAVQSGGELVQASVLVEPDKDNKDESKDIASPISNSSASEERRCSDTCDQTVQMDELRFSGKDRKEKRKLNGDLDRLDGVWVPSREPRKDTAKASDDDDDNCTVKCLYYTMQCCECAIM